MFFIFFILSIRLSPSGSLTVFFYYKHLCIEHQSGSVFTSNARQKNTLQPVFLKCCCKVNIFCKINTYLSFLESKQTVSTWHDTSRLMSVFGNQSRLM